MTETRQPGALLDARQTGTLREDLTRRLRLHPQWPDLWNQSGLLHAHERNLQQADSDFAEAERRHRDYVSARANRSWVASLLGTTAPALPPRTPPRTKAALGFVRNLAAGVAPSHDWTGDDAGMAFLALLHAAGGHGPESVEEAHARLLHVAPESDRLLEAAGWMDSGHLSVRTIRHLSHPERLNPGFADLLLRVSYLDAMAGRDAEAERLQAAAALYRGDVALYLVEQGETASRRGNSDGALEFLREAVDRNPDWHRAHQSLGYELSARGIVGEALHHLADAARLAPKYADVHYQYGLLLHAAGMNEEATDAMGRAVASNPTYLVARIALANLLFEADRAGEAAPHYEHVLEAGIETPALAGEFGYALHAAGHRNRAEELFLDAIARHRNRPELLAHYGQFLMETDRSLEAKAVWDRALESNPSDRLRVELETLLDEIPTDQRGKGA
ncbi:tetratricopeptide repeat protein [bacterium]|nr:tetratricopeptide repeat protein [bacterium]